MLVLIYPNSSQSKTSYTGKLSTQVFSSCYNAILDNEKPVNYPIYFGSKLDNSGTRSF